MISLYIHFKKLIVQNTKSIREWAQLSIIPFYTHSLDALPISALLSWSKSSCCCISRSQSGWQIELKLFFCLTCPKAGPCQSSVRQSGSCLCLNQQIGLTSFPAAERRPSLWSWRDILPKCQKKWPSKNMSDSRNFKTSRRSNDWKLRLYYCFFTWDFYFFASYELRSTLLLTVT